MASETEIDRAAYETWDSRGRPDGAAQDNWRNDATFAEAADKSSSRSEKSAKVDESVQGTFPASDPPSTHIPDKPPANADDKWKAAGISRKG